MTNGYKFITIHTLVDIGDGTTPLIDTNGDITTTANLARIVDTVLRFSHPFMTTILSSIVDLSKDKNKIYYQLGSNWNTAYNVYTFKFAVKTNKDICTELSSSLNNIPVVLINNHIDRFNTNGANKNTTIIEKTII